jgi:hypothetical protein
MRKKHTTQGDDQEVPAEFALPEIVRSQEEDARNKERWDKCTKVERFKNYAGTKRDHYFKFGKV